MMFIKNMTCYAQHRSKGIHHYHKVLIVHCSCYHGYRKKEQPNSSISNGARDSEAPFSRYILLFHLSFTLYGPHFSFTWNHVFGLSLLMSACAGSVPSDVILYGRPVPPAMVSPLLRTYGDASAFRSAVRGNLLVFRFFWFPTDTTYHVFERSHILE